MVTVHGVEYAPVAVIRKRPVSTGTGSVSWHSGERGGGGECCGSGKCVVPASQDYTVFTSLEASHSKVQARVMAHFELELC